MFEQEWLYGPREHMFAHHKTFDAASHQQTDERI